MKTEIYYGNLKQRIYTGYAGNFLGVDHDKIIEEGIYLVKIRNGEYVRLDELLSDKKKTTIIKDFATKKGENFVGDLILVNDIMETQIKKR